MAKFRTDAENVRTALEKFWMDDASRLKGTGKNFKRMTRAVWTVNEKFRTDDASHSNGSQNIWTGDIRRLNCLRNIILEHDYTFLVL